MISNHNNMIVRKLHLLIHNQLLDEGISTFRPVKELICARSFKCYDINQNEEWGRSCCRYLLPSGFALSAENSHVFRIDPTTAKFQSNSFQNYNQLNEKN